MCASHFPTFRKEGKPEVYRSMCASHAPPPKTQAVTRCHRKLTYLHYSFELVYKSYLTTDNMEPQLQKGTGTRYFTTSHPTFSHFFIEHKKKTNKSCDNFFFVSFAPPRRPMILKSHRIDSNARVWEDSYDPHHHRDS